MDTAHLNGGQQKARALGPIRATNTTKRHATDSGIYVWPPAASERAKDHENPRDRSREMASCVLAGLIVVVTQTALSWPSSR